VTVTTARPTSAGEAAELLKTLASEDRAVRPRGGGTKPWGRQHDELALETGGLDRILEHNVGDFTAVLEAGVRVADAQAEFARHGQMLALDPPLGDGDAATVGGVIATADSGPLRHRFGAVRDLVVGITVVLSDGTVAKAGGKVIKNVAGYDLAKLFAGSFGTLGLIASVAVRLHPLPVGTASVRGSADDPDRLAAAARRLAALPLEAESLDVAWSGGRGAVMLRFGGSAAGEQAQTAAGLVREAGLEAEVLEDDDELWARQRAGQRGAVSLKVASVPTELPAVLRAADGAGATVVSRAALGLSWLALEHAPDVAALREALPGATVTVLDGAADADWPEPPAPALEVMRRLKARFDPAGLFRPGTFVGGM
jgi:glycolate oxidase FAD binding subunit